MRTPSPGFRQRRFGRWRRIASPAVFRLALGVRAVSRGQFFDVHCVVNADPKGVAGNTVGSREVTKRAMALTSAVVGTPGVSLARLGLVVPKRVCRSAVQRNWIKRMVRESFRHEMAEALALDCVVRLRRQPQPTETQSVRDELTRHWSRVRS